MIHYSNILIYKLNFWTHKKKTQKLKDLDSLFTEDTQEVCQRSPKQ